MTTFRTMIPLLLGMGIFFTNCGKDNDIPVLEQVDFKFDGTFNGESFNIEEEHDILLFERSNMDGTEVSYGEISRLGIFSIFSFEKAMDIEFHFENKPNINDIKDLVGANLLEAEDDFPRARITIYKDDLMTDSRYGTDTDDILNIRSIAIAKNEVYEVPLNNTGDVIAIFGDLRVIEGNDTIEGNFVSKLVEWE